MTPIMCCGETLAEREAGETEAKVLGQVRAGLAGRRPSRSASMVIAYEPIWAIGTGRTATADDAQQVCAAIRGASPTQFGADAADAGAHPVRRLGEGRHDRRADGAARRRRCAGRRRQPRPRRVRPDRAVRGRVTRCVDTRLKQSSEFVHKLKQSTLLPLGYAALLLSLTARHDRGGRSGLPATRASTSQREHTDRVELDAAATPPSANPNEEDPREQHEA